jgi:hypothetical protein
MRYKKRQEFKKKFCKFAKETVRFLKKEATVDNWYDHYEVEEAFKNLEKHVKRVARKKKSLYGQDD